MPPGGVRDGPRRRVLGQLRLRPAWGGALMDMICNDCDSVSMAQYEADENTVITVCPHCGGDALVELKQAQRQAAERAMKRGDHELAEHIFDCLDGEVL
jgi:hypothetical protein